MGLFSKIVGQYSAKQSEVARNLRLSRGIQESYLLKTVDCKLITSSQFSALSLLSVHPMYSFFQRTIMHHSTMLGSIAQSGHARILVSPITRRYTAEESLP